MVAWTPAEDAVLLREASKQPAGVKTWEPIAEQLPGRTARNCRTRFLYKVNPDIKRVGSGAWLNYTLRSKSEPSSCSVNTDQTTRRSQSE